MRVSSARPRVLLAVRTLLMTNTGTRMREAAYIHTRLSDLHIFRQLPELFQAQTVQKLRESGKRVVLCKKGEVSTGLLGNILNLNRRWARFNLWFQERSLWGLHRILQIHLIEREVDDLLFFLFDFAVLSSIWL